MLQNYSMFCVIPLIPFFPLPRETLWGRAVENWNKTPSLWNASAVLTWGLIAPAASHWPGSFPFFEEEGRNKGNFTLMSISGAFNFMDHQPGSGTVQTNASLERHNLSWSRPKVFRQKQCRKSWCSIPVKYINIGSNFLLVTPSLAHSYSKRFHCTS